MSKQAEVIVKLTYKDNGEYIITSVRCGDKDLNINVLYDISNLLENKSIPKQSVSVVEQ